MVEIEASVLEFLDSPRPMLINGQWVQASSGATFSVENPALGKNLVNVADGSEAEVNAAVSAARAAFESSAWKRTTPARRGELLWNLADAIMQHSESLAQLTVLEQGKPIGLARELDVEGSCDTLRYYAGWSGKLEGATVDISWPDFRPESESGPGYHAYSRKEPVGVVAAIVPWNVPITMAIAKIAPAIAAGCTVVLRPSEVTPLATLMMGQLFAEAGFPDGVINIVTGDGPIVPAALAAHEDVDKVAFTGSTKVGKLIAEAAVKSNLKKVSLELGGNRPVVVCADAELDEAAQGIVEGIFINSGQMCFAGARVLVDASVHDELVKRLKDNIDGIAVGNGLDEDTIMGPLVNAQQHQRVSELMQRAIDDGLQIISGGNPIDGEGYFFEPTLALCPDHASEVVNTEIFGPVVTVTPFDPDASLRDIAALANDTEYGLTASLWTKDLSLAHRLSAEIKSGMVWVNAAFIFDEGLPFGGYKQSGWGREGSHEGVEEYLESKSVMMVL